MNGGGDDEEEEGDDKATPESFQGLQKKVDGLEGSVGNIVSKIDALLGKLESLERAKMSKREEVRGALNSMQESP